MPCQTGPHFQILRWEPERDRNSGSAWDASRAAAIRHRLAAGPPGRRCPDLCGAAKAVRTFRGMRYLALATDYDGTLAEQGRVRQQTVDALVRLRKSGRHAILVTGRELKDLESVFDGLGLFDRVV